MPVEVKGLVELRKALHTYAPDLEQEMNKTWMQSLNSLTTKAKGFIPSSMPRDLHNWESNGNSPMWAGYRPFPKFDGSAARKGIKYSYKASRPNDKGFRSLARISNLSAAGAIYETAGRKNPKGAPRDPYVQTKAQFMADPKNAGLPFNKRYHTTSHKYSASNNPMAGAYFIAMLQHMSPLHDLAPTGGRGRRSRKFKGRAIFRAVVEDQGKTATALIKATELANQKFVSRVNVGTRRAA